MPRQIYEINTTAGKRWGIGNFYKGEMLSGTHHGYFKTKSGAEKKLKKLLG